ncbi:methylthioribulose 1-phosphate dehydratase [Gloeobacter kilaueensis]|uniref:Methylthioribulose-1-phosphate dehydratase n=1 Tax=Gloeobacter kilaueensis (strain ATCC BAA-2537 / CCAP 1431/1 / ULC 316 / JS1) TaxID=1183438 RepID=U5QID7_GLOK1|nr:methylthioribulose 1-phosphate dehydratase [Gloeobacter kilaueensis]AGY57415.1 methylthioribulose-1-phosphate dehydratase [Gloeobacter kilaueensis JS1]
MSSEAAHLRDELAALARQFYAAGWMVGTAGNLSARITDDSFWITASGKAKGRLDRQDFLRLDLEGTVLERFYLEDRPSAETAIHRTLYRCFAAARACLHVHSVSNNLVSGLARAGTLHLPPLEMLKGLAVAPAEARLPVFANHDDVNRIAVEIKERFAAQPPAIPALLIAEHGLTVWGNSIAAAATHLELLEFIFQYQLAARGAGLDIPESPLS